MEPSVTTSDLPIQPLSWGKSLWRRVTPFPSSTSPPWYSTTLGFTLLQGEAEATSMWLRNATVCPLKSGMFAGMAAYTYPLSSMATSDAPMDLSSSTSALPNTVCSGVEGLASTPSRDTVSNLV